MEEKHRQIIARNFSSLVEQTDIDQLVSVLLEKEVFSAHMVEPYLDQMKDKRTRKRHLFRDIERRGPHAFGKLLEALNDIGHWDLVRTLDPDHALHGRAPVISIKTANKAVKFHKQMETHNRVFPKSEPSVMEVNNSNRPDPNAQSKSNLLKVIKSTKFVDEDDDLLSYSTKSLKRGVFFMINNIKYVNDIEDPRNGASIDQETLESLFKQIGFHQFVTHVNLTAQEMQDAVRTFAKSNILKRTDCVFVVVASHGYRKSDTFDTNIRGTDGIDVTASSLLEEFNNINCENLQNIPKVFIFQTCRGDAPDFGLYPENKSRKQPKIQTDGPSRSANTSLRTYSDILIANATIPGFASLREPDSGSWYIQALCEIFAEHAHRRHVEDLFKLVDAKLRDNQHNTKQTSSVDNWGFNKHLYLHPGLFKES